MISLKNLNAGLHSDIHRVISFKLGMMMGTSKLYSLMPVWMTLTFIQGHSCMRNPILMKCRFVQVIFKRENSTDMIL